MFYKILIGFLFCIILNSRKCESSLTSFMDGNETYRDLPAPRTDFFDNKKIIYMNVGSLGPNAKDVIELASKDWSTEAQIPVELYPWSNSSWMDLVRQQAADMLGVQSVNEIALMPSTTVALINVVEGLIFSKTVVEGDKILTTDQEHTGGLAGWNHYKDSGFLSIDYLPLPVPADNEQQILDLFERALKSSNYTVVAVAHVLTTTGMVLPIKELAKIAHENGALLIVDGAQAAGSIDLELSTYGVDAYAMSAHKWLCAPTGNGLLYIPKNMQPKIKSAFLEKGFNAYTQYTGTRPVQTVAGLRYALYYLESFGGIKKIQEYNMKLRSIAYESLKNIETSEKFQGFKLLSPVGGSLASPLLSFKLPISISNSGAYQVFKDKFGIIVKLLPDNEGGTPVVTNAIRVSFHLFNSEHDVKFFVNALKEILSFSIAQ